MNNEELEKIREQRHRELVAQAKWKDDVIFVGSLFGVALIGLLLIITGVIR